MTFTSPRPVEALLKAFEQEVADADAAFQIAQQRCWNQLIQGRSLLEGYDRLTNLGLAEVRIAVGLTAVRPGWFRRRWNELTGRTEEPMFRPITTGEAPTLQITVLVRRDGMGRFTTSVVQETDLI